MTTAHKFLLVVATLLTFACGPPARIEPDDLVAISPEFSAEEAELILDAAAEWGAATNGAVHQTLLVSSDSNGHRFVPNSMVAFGQTRRSRFNGDVTIHINPQLIAERSSDYATGFRQVVLHELLHGMGYEGHAAQGLMRARVVPGDHPCIDAATAEAYCAMNGCANGWSSTCEALP